MWTVLFSGRYELILHIRIGLNNENRFVHKVLIVLFFVKIKSRKYCTTCIPRLLLFEIGYKSLTMGDSDIWHNNKARC
jgi:hypothetical protein